ncbi:MAG: DUF465 domain-containing protein [Alphaproteobacteria bacterium]|jgi:hypothetical protein|nr:DUF465 domain-containing protein [Alphaproteobacteria bacterium]
MTTARIRALQARRLELQEALADELRRPMPNLGAVRLLKQRRLRLKDEIAALLRTRVHS